MTWYPLYRSGSQGRSGRVRKISTPTGIPFPDRPGHSESLAVPTALSRPTLYSTVGSTQIFNQILLLRIACTVGYAATNECYNEQFLSVKSGYHNEQRSYNERGGILSTDVTRACDDVSGLPALIRASVIIFVIVCKVQL